MKNCLLFLATIVIVLICSCASYSNPSFVNNTNEDVGVTIIYEDGSQKTHTIKANSRYENFDFLNIKDVRLTKADNSISIIRQNSRSYIIEIVEPKSITIRVSLPANAFGSEKIYLSEENGKMGKVYAPLELTEGLIKTVECYGSSKLYLSDLEGNPKTTFNGYPVLMIKTDDNLMVIL